MKLETAIAIILCLHFSKIIVGIKVKELMPIFLSFDSSYDNILILKDEKCYRNMLRFESLWYPSFQGFYKKKILLC